MTDDDWDKLSRPDEPLTPTVFIEEASAETVSLADVIDAIAPRLVEAVAQAKAAQAEVKKLTEDLARFTPEAAGEITISGNHFVVSVKRTERFEWDSEILAALYADKEDLPAHIKMKLSVDKKRYDRMSEDDKEALASALTIKLSAPTVEVRTHV